MLSVINTHLYCCLATFSIHGFKHKPPIPVLGLHKNLISGLATRLPLHSKLHHTDIQQKPALCVTNTHSCLIYWPTTTIFSSLKEWNVVLKWFVHNTCTSSPILLSKACTHNIKDLSELKALHLDWWYIPNYFFLLELKEIMA